ncbi:unnamed protein product [Rotaria sp. Silwood1]|nr:unnamed protein product [Rotaria sp. Silwood1]
MITQLREVELRSLYRYGFLPERTRFTGYAHSQITLKKIFENSEKFMKVQEHELEIYDNFRELNSYVADSYNNGEDFQRSNSQAN